MRKAVRMIAVGLVVMLAAGPVLAQDDTTASEAMLDGAGEPASLTVLDVAGKLLIVLAIAWGVVRVVRWWHDRRLTCSSEEGRRGRQMWLEETLPLGADGRLYLVEVEGRRILLAAGDGNVVEVADVSAEPLAPATYRSVRKRTDGSADELNVRANISTGAVRPDVVERDESWEERRGRLLRELQEQG